MEMISEKDAENIYNQVLNDIIYPLLGKKITWAKDLNRIGMKLFGNNFTGVHSSDTIPILGVNSIGVGLNFKPIRTTNNNINAFSRLYSIANLDDSTMPGSHWIALAYDIESRKVWVYDSFGRKTSEIMPNLIEQYKDISTDLMDVDDDAEQKVNEDDCGARSMAWLFVFDRYGVDLARLI